MSASIADWSRVQDPSTKGNPQKLSFFLRYPACHRFTLSLVKCDKVTSAVELVDGYSVSAPFISG